MRSPLPHFIAAGAMVALLAACSTDEDNQQDDKPHRYGHNSTEQHGPAPTEVKTEEENNPPSAESTPKVEISEPAVTPVPNPTPMPTPAVADYPQATPVEGKPGFVKSPFSESGIVDVRGYPPGTEVRDPYSGKIFLVP